MQRSEGFFEGFLETKLFFQTWEPKGESFGLLVVTHGHGEHSESYSRLIAALEDLRWTVVGWDLRGHGRSEGPRGFAMNFLDYVRDFECLWNQVLPGYRKPQTPTAFFGHSMGALVQLKALGEIHGGEAQAQILSSPFLGLTLDVPAYKEAAAHVLRRWLPQATLWNEIHNEDLTRDPLVLDEYAKDPLRHNKISAGVFLGARECQASVLARPQIWRAPILMLVADQDPVVDTKTNLQFYERLSAPGRACAIFEHRKHELINDLGRDEVFSKIHTFLSGLQQPVSG